MRQKRLKYIDYAKGWALMVICLSHMIDSTPPSDTFGKILSWLVGNWMFVTVPLFFFISGFLFYPEKHANVRTYIKRKVRALLLPYFVLSLLFTFLSPYLYKPSYLTDVLGYPRTGLLSGVVSVKIAAVIEWFFGDVLCSLIGVSSRSSLPLWFVFTLFLVSVVFALLLSRMGKFSILMTGVIAMIVALILPRNNILVYLHVHAHLMAFFFYMAGFFFRDYMKMEQRYKWLLLVVSALACLFTWHPGCNGFVTGLFGNPSWKWMIHSLAGICASICFFDLIELFFHDYTDKIFKPFTWVSKNGLPIIAVHFWAMLVYLVFIKQYVASALQLPLLIVFVCIVVCLTVPMLNKLVLRPFR